MKLCKYLVFLKLLPTNLNIHQRMLPITIILLKCSNFIFSSFPISVLIVGSVFKICIVSMAPIPTSSCGGICVFFSPQCACLTVPVSMGPVKTYYDIHYSFDTSSNFLI